MKSKSNLSAVAAILEFRVASPERSEKADLNAVSRILNRHCPLGKSIGAKREARLNEQDEALEQATQMESPLIRAGVLPR